MALVIKDLTRSYDRSLAINQVTATIEKGTVNVLLGANGAGKSTLLKLMAGEIQAGAGEVRLDGHLVKPTRSRIRKNFFLLDTPPRRNDVRAADSILDVINDYDLDNDKLAKEATSFFQRLNLVGLFPKTWTQLSKGQGYKMMMVGLFLARPLVWMLDEPYSCGLDANGLEVLNDEIRRHRSDNGIVIFSSQWPQEAKHLADRFIVLNKGAIAWDAPVGQKPLDSMVDDCEPGLQSVLKQVVLDVH